MGFCVGTVALLLAVLLNSRDALAPGNQTAGTVVVAKVPIPFGAKITPEQLELAPIPNGPAPEGAFDSPDKVAGRVAVIPIGVREPVTGFKLAAEGTVGGLKAVIPEGYRAMTVHVGEVVGGSGSIMPGSFVDVMCVITPPGGWRRGPISKIVLQNIKVLANNQNLDQPKGGREAAQDIRAVTLLVTPDQAEKLALASSEGMLQLVLRDAGSARHNSLLRTP
jgi:pilus assembly protein CpaB